MFMHMFQESFTSRSPSTLTTSEIEPELVVKTSYRGRFLRIVFVVCMILLTAGLGYVTFYFFRSLETKLFETQFLGSAELLQRAISTDFQNTNDAGIYLIIVSFGNYCNMHFMPVIASELSITVSHGSVLSPAWPNATFPYFQEISKYRLRMINYRAIAIYHIVTNENRAGYEAYCTQMVSQDLVEGAELIKKNPWPVSNGISVFNGTGNAMERVRDDGTHNGLLFPNTYAPSWQISPLSLSTVIMQNAMADPTKRSAIEYVLTNKSSTLSDVVNLAIDVNHPLPSSQLYAPVFLNDGINQTVIALIVYSFSWDTFLSNILADFVHGINIVMTSPTQQYTFLVNGELASVFSSGDAHNSAFNGLQQSFTLGLQNISGNNFLRQFPYSFSVYPTQALADSYLTSTPYIAMSIVVVLCLLTIAIFLIYVNVTVDHAKRMLTEQVRTEAEANFISFLAHEVRNPLSGIDSCSQLMLQRDLDKRAFLQRKVAEQESIHHDEITLLLGDIEEPIQDNVHIRKCITYIQSILNSTLDISKLDDGRLDFRFKNVYLRTEILELAMTMLASMKAANITTELVCKDEVFVIADPLRLTQVVVNLLTNAFKFCKVFSSLAL